LEPRQRQRYAPLNTQPSFPLTLALNVPSQVPHLTVLIQLHLHLIRQGHHHLNADPITQKPTPKSLMDPHLLFIRTPTSQIVQISMDGPGNIPKPFAVDEGSENIPRHVGGILKIFPLPAGRETAYWRI